ncbi:MAG TPA: hypothetical protein VK168_04580 [Saprospiraceae bacterium]|nr:hypothetical protein [Saprospiraceae bacterium]
MNQLFTRLAYASGLAALLFSCNTSDNCRDLTGRWSNREGQILVFEPEGKATWLVKFGSQYDTFAIRYQYDCTQKTTTLDLTEFKSGPMAGKTLYGIVEWSSDTVFRFDAEAGTSPEARPLQFNAEHFERYFKE